MRIGSEQERDFDAWLERSLRRELGRFGAATPPEREWVTLARPRRRRLTVASGAGGAVGAKAATGLVVAAFAAATGTAVTGTANPVVWGEALEAAATSLPDRVEGPSSAAPAATEKPAPAPAYRPAAPADVAAAAPASPSPTARADLKHTPRPHASAAPKRHGHEPSD